MQQYRALRTVHANTRDKNDAAMDGRMSYRPIQVACITNAHGGGERRAQVHAAGETRPRQGRRRRVDWAYLFARGYSWDLCRSAEFFGVGGRSGLKFDSLPYIN